MYTISVTRPYRQYGTICYYLGFIVIIFRHYFPHNMSFFVDKSRVTLCNNLYTIYVYSVMFVIWSKKHIFHASKP